MLDMGGAPSGLTDQSLSLRPPNVSKNSKLQAVAFDFEILTRSLQDAATPAAAGDVPKPTSPTASNRSNSSTSVHVTPDLNQIQQIASLLNVAVDTGPTAAAAAAAPKSAGHHPSAPPAAAAATADFVGYQDIRAKYASKLKGGVYGVELAKSKTEDALKGGDAPGHWAARKLAMQTSPSDASSPNKWMALSGTGQLLAYLTHRGIKIALLPNTRLNDPQRQDTEFKFMSEFNKQLKDIVVDAVVPYDDNGTKGIKSMLQQGVIDDLDIHPNKILMVSDKDEYLSMAKDLGMITCRLRPKNARRGNITAHYNAEDVASVQEVVNEITGISFSAVLNR